MRTDLKSQCQCVPTNELIHAVGCDRVIEVSRKIVPDRSKQRALRIGCLASLIQIVIQLFLGAGMQRDVARLVTFSMDSQMRHTAPANDVLHSDDTLPHVEGRDGEEWRATRGPASL